MPATRCIVRAYADEPLDRIAVAFERKNVFVVKCTAVDRGDLSGSIGFPEANIYTFDFDLFHNLMAAYQQGTPDLVALWDSARPLEADLPLLERV